MRDRRLTLGLLLLCETLAGCVSRSTAADRAAVQTLVRERVREHDQLELPERRNDGAEIARLLAQPLTVDAAIHVALINNRELGAQLLELGIARGELVAANVFPNPAFEAQVRFSEHRKIDPAWELGANIDLTEIVLRGARTDVAQAELGAARIRVAGATLDLAYLTRLAYYELQAAEQRLELRKTALAAFAASYETAQALQEAGNLSTLDLVTEQAAYETARDAVSAAEMQRVTKREAFATLLGLERDATSFAIEPRLPEPTAALPALDQLETRATDASLELAEGRAMLEVAARRLDLSDTAGVVPKLRVGVAAERDITGWAVGPALSGTLPVFDRQQGASIANQAELDAARERYVWAAIELHSAVRVTRAHAESAAERVQRFRETLLPLHERVVKETVLQHNAMQASVFQLLQARREQISAASMYVETLLEYWQARATLDQLLAGRLVKL